MSNETKKPPSKDEDLPLTPLQVLVACVFLGGGMACMLGVEVTVLLLAVFVVYLLLKK